MGSFEIVTAQKKADIENGFALLGERSVVEQTGCAAIREGDTWTFRMENQGEPMLVRSAIHRAIEETGCFDILEAPNRKSNRREPAIADGSS